MLHPTSHPPSIFKGFVFAMLSGVSYFLVSVLVKQMQDVHPGQLAMHRFIGTFVLAMPETAKTGQSPLGPRNVRFFLVFRGMCGGLNIFLNFISFQYLGLGEATVIIFSSPIFVTLFARIFFKEPCSILQSITVVLTVIGIAFTTKLPSSFSAVPITYSNEKFYGLLAAIFSSFSLSAVQLLVRKMRNVHDSIITFNHSWVAILVDLFLTTFFGYFKWQECGIQSIYILLLALFSYSALKFLVIALQYEYAGPVSTVRAASAIVLAFLWQIWFFQDVPDSYGIIGAIFVSVSIILIGLGKWLTNVGSNFSSCEIFKCSFELLD